MSKAVTINTTTLEQITYRDMPVVTFQQIADVHGISVKNIHESFRRNRKRFTEGKHYFRLDFTQLPSSVEVSPNGLTVFTEKGYLLLSKPMRDDKSWEIQERMIDEYFTLQTDRSALYETLASQSQKDDPSYLTKTEMAHRELVAWMDLSKVFDAPLHIAQIEAVKAIEATTGVNLKPLLAHAPAQRNIPDAAVMLEPTSLGKVLGYKNGHEMNLALESLGWQVRDDGGEWTPTALGQPYAIRNSWVSRHSSKAGYNWRWNRAAVSEALERMRRVP